MACPELNESPITTICTVVTADAELPAAAVSDAPAPTGELPAAGASAAELPAAAAAPDDAADDTVAAAADDTAEVAADGTAEVGGAVDESAESDRDADAWTVLAVPREPDAVAWPHPANATVHIANTATVPRTQASRPGGWPARVVKGN